MRFYAFTSFENFVEFSLIILDNSRIIFAQNDLPPIECSVEWLFGVFGPPMLA
eukprot:TRINITY_DN10570_c0_g1_i1.p1 TRINITY_DN10570_c0_g1~~TRINITY_DN10570_c0_g1_i1.p1  ORF type:complete len:53 (-),score=6.17 TRINITY_DN10570_c0_g1_i1:229-387(-)